MCVYVCLSVASFETFGSGSFGGPLGGPVGFGGPLGVRWGGPKAPQLAKRACPPRGGLEGEPRSGSNF